MVHVGLRGLRGTVEYLKRRLTSCEHVWKEIFTFTTVTTKATAAIGALGFQEGDDCHGAGSLTVQRDTPIGPINSCRSFRGVFLVCFNPAGKTPLGYRCESREHTCSTADSSGGVSLRRGVEGLRFGLGVFFSS